MCTGANLIRVDRYNLRMTLAFLHDIWAILFDKTAHIANGLRLELCPIAWNTVIPSHVTQHLISICEIKTIQSDIYSFSNILFSWTKKNVWHLLFLWSETIHQHLNKRTIYLDNTIYNLHTDTGELIKMVSSVSLGGIAILSQSCFAVDPNN